jgi:oligosaccharide 4-alpha-D-glucosyltransferase
MTYSGMHTLLWSEDQDKGKEMKRNIHPWAFLSVIVLLACNSISISSSDILVFEQNRLVLESTDMPYLTFGLTVEGNLEIDWGGSPGEFTEGFWYSEELSQEVPQKSGQSYTWGDYRILGGQEGWVVYYGGEILTQAEWTGGKWYFRTKSGQSFFGMNGVDESLELDDRAFDLVNRSEYGNHTFLHVPLILSQDGRSFWFQNNYGDFYEFGPVDSGEFAMTPNMGTGRLLLGKHESLKDGMIQHYRRIGEIPLLPRYAYGYLQSRYGYRNNEEVVAIVEEFKERDLALDAIILDLYWFDKMGDHSPDPENWDFAILDNYLEREGVKLIVISEPYYREDSILFQEWEDEGFFVTDTSGETILWSSWWTFDQSKVGSMINLFAPGVEQDLGAVYSGLRSQGVDAFWTDLGEPEENPADALFRGENGVYESGEIHNFYNQRWSQIIHDRLLADFPQDRVFILSRSGNWRSPAYGVSVWSGDVRSQWYVLEDQIAQGLANGLVGFSYWGSDVGGFLQSREFGVDLLNRWMQFGAWSPVFRPHGAQVEREPFQFDDEADNALVSQSVRLRERILPYVYSTAYQTHEESLPMMRALFLDYPDWAPAWEEDQAYLFGDFVYVRPIVQENNQVTYSLPPGTWKHLLTGEVLAGDTTYTANRDESWYPVYLREGSIFPQEVDGRLEILLYPGEEAAEFFILQDSGDGHLYKDDPQGIHVKLESDQVTLESNLFATPLRLVLLETETDSGEWSDGSQGKTLEVDLAPGQTRILW